MDELIYRFLLQSGFPRASIVTDLSLLPLAGAGSVPGDDGSATGGPSLAVVDPDTADRLAVVKAVGALDGDGLRAAAARLAAFARRFGGRSVQGFLVRVDERGADPDERVQFYRVWPVEELERVTAEAFPDLDTMRVWQRLAERRALAATPGAGAGGARAAAPPGDLDEGTVAARAAAFGEDAGTVASAGARPSRPGAWVWLPGLALVALAIADLVVDGLGATGFLGVARALLATGAASLLLAAGLARRN